MRVGRMDRKIVLKRPDVQNTLGDVTTKPLLTVATVWADVRPMSASERFRSDALHSVRVSNFRIWHRNDVTPDMLIQYEGLDWRITGIAEIGYREGLDITAEAVY